jgi:transcription-repair coupling factor (superfamily II helicase)
MAAPLSPLIDRWRAPDLPAVPGRWVVAPGGRAPALAALARRLDGPLLVVIPGERDAEELALDLALFAPDVALVPAWETLPFEHLSPNAATMARRCEGRRLLREGGSGRIVVASVRATLQRLSPSLPDPVGLARGEEAPLPELARALAALGYHRTDRVEARGEFAVRGGILDVFPAQAEEPARLDFWGDTVEDIRAFAVGDQRSRDPLDELEAFPAREFRADREVAALARGLVRTEPWNAAVWDRLAEGHLFEGMESWMPWFAPARSLVTELPAGGALVLVDPARVADRGRELTDEEASLAEALAPTWGAGAPAAGAHPGLFLDLAEALTGAPVLELPAVPSGLADRDPHRASLDATPGDPESVASARLRAEQRRGGGGGGDGRGRRRRPGGPGPRRERPPLERSRDARHSRCWESRRSPAGGGHTDEPAAGEPPPPVRSTETSRGRLRRPPSNHGIGRFEGLVSRTMAGVERDYLVVAYAGADKLYVPTDQLAAVTKYTGGEEPHGCREWAARTGRNQGQGAQGGGGGGRGGGAAASAPGNGGEGHAYPPDSPWQREMEASFPFEETPDQLTAITDVKADMEGDEVMDRLVFGDVGFGKTEVAIRAAFKAVEAASRWRCCARPRCSPSSTTRPSPSGSPLSAPGRDAVRFLTQRQRGRSWPGSPRARSTSWSAPTGCCPRTSVQGPRAARDRRGAALRGLAKDRIKR